MIEGVEHCAKLVGKFPHAKLVAVGEPSAPVLVGAERKVPGSDTVLILLLFVVDEVGIVDEGRGVCDEGSI